MPSKMPCLWHFGLVAITAPLASNDLRPCCFAADLAGVVTNTACSPQSPLGLCASVLARRFGREKPLIVCRLLAACKNPAALPDNRAMNEAEERVPTAVIDTNVVLDWLVFRNPTTQPLVDSLLQGRLCWIGTQAMRDELAHVLAQGHLDRWHPDPIEIWSAWDQHCRPHPTPAPRHLARFRCSDADDQMFVDLALEGAAWLLTRDRALLRLAPRLRTCRVQTSTPEAWAEVSRTLAPG